MTFLFVRKSNYTYFKIKNSILGLWEKNPEMCPLNVNGFKTVFLVSVIMFSLHSFLSNSHNGVCRVTM